MLKIYQIFLTLSGAVGLVFLGFWKRLPQRDPVEYFNFSDQRIIWGIPYFGDVLSNLVFVIAGIIGLRLISKNLDQEPFFTKLLFKMFSLGLVGVGVGSSYFHWDPTPATLFWDRLPMAWCFGTILTLVLMDRAKSSNGAPVLWATILILSLSSVFLIDMGLNDLRPYFIVQFGSLLMILMLISFYKGHYLIPSRTLFLMLVLYALAKIFETYDKQIHQQLLFLSGHNLKHIAAAFASSLLFLGLKKKIPTLEQK